MTILASTRRRRIAVGLIVVLGVVTAIIYWPGGPDPDSSDPDERLAAARDLAGRTDEGSVATLRRLSDDRQERVAIAAVGSLAKGRTAARNRKVLVAILDESDSRAARSAAASAIGDCPEVDLKLLTRVLHNVREDPVVRAGAARGIGRRRDPAGLPQLLNALEDDDPRVRLWAITAIGRITALRFRYDAARPPSEQVEEIRRIRTTLITRRPPP